jgi:hypothetical protein
MTPPEPSAAAPVPRPRPNRASGPPRYRLTRRGRLVFILLPAVLVGAIWLFSNGGGDLALAGIEPGASLGADSAEPTISVTTDQPTEDLMVTLDGSPLPMTPAADGTLTATLTGLTDGEHSLEAVLTRSFPFGALEATRTFTLDTTPPTVTVLSPTDPVPVGDPIVVKAQIDDLEADVTVDGTAVAFDEDGNFERSYPEVPDAAVVVTATDSLGNTNEQVVPIELALPGSPGAPPIMGVHATGWTWATPELKDPIMELVDAGLINTVELDLKDEAGDIWYDTEVALAQEIGAVTVLFDLATVVEELHDKGVRVVARIVNFRDPRLAEYAVDSGNLDWVVQKPDGSPYGQYGGFTNPFNPDVREYNIALAEEAARLGVDDVLYDYVRRPDTLAEIVYPGQDGTPDDAIVSFLAESMPRVHAAGARLGASVFGVAATRPTEIAQDIPRMAEHVDYVAPMTYPSHWGPGEYGVDHPNAQPYDITFRALEDFMTQTAGTRAHVVAWLQDFSLGIDYGPAEVRAQIQAAKDAGVENILLWDAATTYTRAALDPLE